MNKTVKIIIGAIAVIAVGALVWFILASRGTFEPQQETNVTTIDGEVECLPLKDSTQPSDLKCQLGLKNSRGMFLELQGNLDGITTGKKVKLVGEVTVASPESKYASVGLIKVEKVVQ